MKQLKWLGLLIILFVGVAIASNAPNPMVMMKKTTNKMLAALKANRSRIKKDSNFLYRLVDRIVVPHADVLGMSRSVLGRSVWTKASASEKQQFIKAFKRVVVNTYASALNAYTDQTVRFYPIRGGYARRRRIQVMSQIIQTGGRPPVSVNYKLALKKGEWKFYDLNVEGVSLLQSFHAQFADMISQGKTLKQIIRDLNARKTSKK